MACKLSRRSLIASGSPIVQIKQGLLPSRSVPSSACAHRPITNKTHHSVYRFFTGRYKSATTDVRCRGSASPPSLSQELTVQDAMDEDPFVLVEETPIREAIEKMLACGASAAIVVSSEKGMRRVVGMLSETDLLWKGAGAPEAHYVIPPVYLPLLEATFSWPDKQAFDSEARKVLAKTVGDAMTRKSVTITQAAPLSTAATKMLHNKVSQLPVLDGDGCLVGSISRHDVLAALVTKHSPFFT